MRKKLISIIFIVLLFAPLIPETALAATHTVDDGQSFNIDAVSSGDTISISPGATATIYSTSGSTYANVAITCGNYVALTLENVHIDNSGNNDVCALSFNGSGNTLILENANVLRSGAYEPGVRVENGTVLEIRGTGSLDSIGGSYGAGIGGGGTGDGGSIAISGGTVTATGGLQGAGVGGGMFGDGGSITISGGTVTATSGSWGAGIGGGDYGDGGSITISGGTIFAKRGYNADYDIGPGSDGNHGSLEIVSNAIVFLRNDASTVPTTSHMHFTYVTDSMLSGTSLPAGWPSAGVYYIAYQLTYDDNGGTGSRAILVPIGTTTTVDDASGFSMPGYSFMEWNTQASGGVTSYNPGDSILMDSFKTLYAIWEEIEVTGVTLSDSAVTLDPGDSIFLTADVAPSDAADKTVAWASNSTGAATVNQSGAVTAVAAGTATITATAGNQSDTCTITVTQPVTSVSLSSDSQSLITGDTVDLSATVLPVSATYPQVTWTSTNTSVATVDASGRVTAVAKGSASIIATADGVTDVCSVQVNERAVSSVSLSSSSETLYVGDIVQLNATVLPANAAHPQVTWTSTNTSVATVDASGRVTAVAKGGASIIATADGVSDVCTIEVKEKEVSGVSLSRSSANLNVGDTIDLTATVLPSGASYSGITWQSTDSSVASVSANGNVIASGKGVATIIATVGGVSGVCTIGVDTIPVWSVTLSCKSEQLSIGHTLTLNATVTPGNADNRVIVWKSTDSKVATVDSSGNVTAAGTGFASIIATADGVSDVCTVLVNEKTATDILLSSTVKIMDVGDVVTLSAQITPQDAAGQSITWLSSNTKVAAVDANGNVTAVAPGYASIGAYSGGMVAMCSIGVKSPELNTDQEDGSGDQDSPGGGTDQLTQVNTDPDTGNVINGHDTENDPRKILWAVITGVVIGIASVFVGIWIYIALKMRSAARK